MIDTLNSVLQRFERGSGGRSGEPRQYGVKNPPVIVRARAPLRLGFGGGGSDLSPFCDLYGGYVLNATINMFVYAILEAPEKNLVSFVAADRQEIWECEPTTDMPLDGAMALHKAVYYRIMQDFNGGRAIPVTLTTYSDVAAGSGLGSSSTLVVAMVEAFKEFLNLPLGEYEVAQLAYKIERIDVGLIGGRQDQYAATFGGFNFMEFYKEDRVIVNPLRIRRNIVDELEASLVLYNSGVPRDSDAIIQTQASNVKRGDEDSIQATHSLKEEAVAMKEALLKGSIRCFAEALNQGWVNKKKTASKVSNAELERIYHAAREAGAYAGKVSGAGGGGFMMFVVDPVRRPAVLRALQKESGQAMCAQFREEGATAWRLR
jgi:D-glycero-alpha-D-manno-heptose-7-phosphate kinase